MLERVSAESLNCVQHFVSPWTVPTRLLCPWNFPGKSTRVGWHFLFQGIFKIQGDMFSSIFFFLILFTDRSKILTSSIELTWGPHNPNKKISIPTKKEQYSCDRKIPCSQRVISYMNPDVYFSFLHIYSCSNFKAKGNSPGSSVSKIFCSLISALIFFRELM